MEPVFEELRRRLSERPGQSLNLPGLELRDSAVLVPLFLRGGELHVLFTKRPKTLRSHAGQISFPGGARESMDLTPLHTALREAREELGIPQQRVEVLGLLDEIPTITQFRITPFVGVIPADLRYQPSEEVEQVIEARVSELANPAIQRVEKRVVWEQEREIYFYDFGPHLIWGATARILRGLLAILAELVPR